MIQRMMMLTALGATLAVSGCKQEKDKTDNTTPPTGKPVAAQNADANPGNGGGHPGEPIPLGTTKIGAFDVKAARDAGALTAGGDAPIDVWLTGPIENVKAVRFWIGTRNGVESIKARADIENPDQPNHWHTHAEIPNPMPEGSRLWVEIETADQTEAGAFDL